MSSAGESVSSLGGAGFAGVSGGNGHARDKELVSVYFDTAKHELRKHGMSLRVRHIGDQRIQTVKANGPSAAGLFQRREWETPIKSDTPDLRAVRKGADGKLLDLPAEEFGEPIGHRGMDGRWARRLGDQQRERRQRALLCVALVALGHVGDHRDDR